MPLPVPPDAARVLVADVEVFPNWYLVVVTDGSRWKVFTPENVHLLRPILCDKKNVIAGFNNEAYDDVILRRLAVYPSPTTEEIYTMSSLLIGDDPGVRNLRYARRPWAYSIDVFQLLNGKGSLKEWGCREQVGDAMESPYDFTKPLPDEGKVSVETYCRNDVAVTLKLLEKRWGLVVMRDKLAKMFNLGFRVHTLSEPKLAQATFLAMHKFRTGKQNWETRTEMEANVENSRRAIPLSELVVNRVKYHTPAFQVMFDKYLEGSVFGDEPGTSWALKLPDSDTNIVRLAGVDFQLGVGGLHSIDGPGVFAADEKTRIVDLDVTSYYPSIIINELLHPKQLGYEFALDMRKLRDMRVAAKRAGDKTTADALKIVINSTFGKLNDMFSPLRSIPDALRVTLNGQLMLLMLVERLASAGATILSANTDGVTIMVKRSVDLAPIVKAWEEATQLELELVDYRRVCRRDVNTYLAISIDGKVKRKGALSPETGKGDGLVIKRAIEEHLLNGLSIERVVRGLAFGDEETGIKQDLGSFLFYQRCKNGGTLKHGDEPLGRLARWYMSKSGNTLYRVNPNGSLAKLPHGESSTLCMGVPTFGPSTIDLDRYVAEAKTTVDGIVLPVTPTTHARRPKRPEVAEPAAVGVEDAAPKG